MVPGFDYGYVGREEGFSVQLAWLGGRDKERWDGDCLSASMNMARSKARDEKVCFGFKIIQYIGLDSRCAFVETDLRN